MTPAELDATLEREFPLQDHDAQEGTLWHYTNAEGLKGILTTSAIWATHFAHMNDTEELLFGHALALKAIGAMTFADGTCERRIVDRIRAVWEGAVLHPRNAFFIAAFCEDSGNELSQWRGYGAFGAGYSIGFRALPGSLLKQVRYSDPRNIDGDAVAMIDGIARRGAAILGRNARDDLVEKVVDHLFYALALLTLQTKNSAFRDEREWRLVSLGETDTEYRTGARGLIPYTTIPVAPAAPAPKRIDLEGIYVGPSHNTAASVAAVVLFLQSLGYADAESLVQPSGIPFRG